MTHVLLVEDEEDVRNVVSQFLTHLKFQVTTATNGAEALKIIQQEASGIDIVLSDVEMPIICGAELIEKTRSLNHTVPFLFMTGGCTILRRLRIERYGATILPKPQYGRALAAHILATLTASL
jgi:two-component system cell cycle sensor histidine kinase/response regulator CckA